MRTLTLLFAAILLLVLPARAVAQQPAPSPGTLMVPLGWKDPGTATLISVLITGGGQMYAGESGRGLALLGGSVGALLVGAALSTAECSVDYYGYEECTVNTAPLGVGALVSLGLWIYGIADADDAAKRHNAKLIPPSSWLPDGIQPLLEPGSAGGTRVGMTLSF